VTRPTIAVSVVWATPDVQDIVALRLTGGATVGEAITRSALAARHGIDLRMMRIAIFGRPVGNDAVLVDGDRIDICRPLVADPKEARRRRAKTRA
jgi:putative ubiquitin-RnfH superfamily antitoxin RatB of RatAB toxin-antitoxin module